MSEYSNFFALEPRIMFDGAAAADVVDATNAQDDADDNVSKVEENNTKIEVVLISKAIQDHADLKDAVKGDVLALTYDANASLDDILTTLREALDGRQASSIALASHGGSIDGSFYVGADTEVSLFKLATDAKLRSFFKDVGAMIQDSGRLDILACDFGKSLEGRYTHKLLSDLVGRTVAASDDKTGNASEGGDWHLEIGDIDASQYFDGDRIKEFDDLLMKAEVVKEIGAGATGSNVTIRATINGSIYFTANDAVNGAALWKSDGTEGGTVLLKTIDSANVDDAFGDFIQHDGKLYFAADNGTNGKELWVSDGTTLGTKMLKDIRAGGDSADVQQFVVFNNEVHFVAQKDDNNQGVWKTDGTDAGTVEVFNVPISSGYSFSIKNLSVFKDKLVFAGTQSGTGTEVWVSDGTQANTEILKNIGETYRSSNPYGFTEFNGALYFFAFDYDKGHQLWRTDGTEVNTTLVKSFDPTTVSSVNYKPGPITILNGKMLFGAFDKTHGTELWVSDGTEQGTKVLKDINVGSTYGYGSVHSQTAILNNEMYFIGYTEENGRELWKTDGTEEGTVLVYEVIKGSQYSTPAEVTTIGNHVWFLSNGHNVYRTDGTVGNGYLVRDFREGRIFSGTKGSFGSLNGDVFVAVDTVASGRELIRLVDTNPNIDLKETSVQYDENQTGKDDNNETKLFPLATLADVDGDFDWLGGKIVIEILGADKDQLSLLYKLGDLDGLSYSSSFGSTIIIKRDGKTIATAAFKDSTMTIDLSKSDGGYKANATNDDVQKILRALYVKANEDNPSEVSHQIKVTATDRDGNEAVGNAQVAVTPENDSPVLKRRLSPGDNGITQVRENAGAVQFADSTWASDPDGLLQWNGGALKLEFLSNSESTDQFSVTVDYVWNMQGNTVTFHGRPIAERTIVKGLNGQSDQVIFTFNKGTDGNDVRSFVQRLEFSTTSEKPDTFRRTVQMTLTDADGASAKQTYEIDVEAVNDVPTLKAIKPSIALTNKNAIGKFAELAILEDVDEHSNWKDGYLDITLSEDTPNGDKMTFVDLEGTGLRFEGNSIFDGTTKIADVVDGGAEFTVNDGLSIKFGEDSRLSHVQTLIQALTYNADTAEKNETPREIVIRVTDPDNATVEVRVDVSMRFLQNGSKHGPKADAVKAAPNVQPVTVTRDPVFARAEATGAGEGTDGGNVANAARTLNNIVSGIFSGLGSDGARTVNIVRSLNAERSAFSETNDTNFQANSDIQTTPFNTDAIGDFTPVQQDEGGLGLGEDILEVELGQQAAIKPVGRESFSQQLARFGSLRMQNAIDNIQLKSKQLLG